MRQAMDRHRWIKSNNDMVRCVWEDIWKVERLPSWEMSDCHTSAVQQIIPMARKFFSYS